MNNHIGYESNDKGAKHTDNRRNDYTKEIIEISQGEVEIELLRDSFFELFLVPKRKKMYQL